jgi:hypothetical protein
MRLLLHTLAGASAPRIVRAPAGRAWMGAHPDAALFAANACWFVLNATPFVAQWDGGESAGALRIESEDMEGAAVHARSRLGRGVLSFDIDCTAALDEGYDLLVTGPLNRPKDGIQPLTSIMSASTPLAVHWRFTRRHAPVAFELDEPICTIAPIPRGLLQSFEPDFQSKGEGGARTDGGADAT